MFLVFCRCTEQIRINPLKGRKQLHYSKLLIDIIRNNSSSKCLKRTRPVWSCGKLWTWNKRNGKERQKTLRSNGFFFPLNKELWRLINVLISKEEETSSLHSNQNREIFLLPVYFRVLGRFPAQFMIDNENKATVLRLTPPPILCRPVQSGSYNGSDQHGPRVDRGS